MGPVLYKIINCNPGNKELPGLNPTTPHSRHPSGGPGNIKAADPNESPIFAAGHLRLPSFSKFA
jgi:hypothetical protein